MLTPKALKARLMSHIKASFVLDNVGVVYVKGETVRGTFQSSLFDKIDDIVNMKNKQGIGSVEIYQSV